MRVDICKINHSGEGIGFVDGKIVFVPKAVPGDVVDIEIIKEHKNYKYVRFSLYVLT